MVWRGAALEVSGAWSGQVDKALSQEAAPLRVQVQVQVRVLVVATCTWLSPLCTSVTRPLMFSDALRSGRLR